MPKFENKVTKKDGRPETKLMSNKFEVRPWRRERKCRSKLKVNMKDRRRQTKCLNGQGRG